MITDPQYDLPTSISGGSDAWDDLQILRDEFFTAAVLGNLKKWNGTSWVTVPLKRWSGSAWVDVNLKRFNGSSWV